MSRNRLDFSAFKFTDFGSKNNESEQKNDKKWSDASKEANSFFKHRHEWQNNMQNALINSSKYNDVIFVICNEIPPQTISMASENRDDGAVHTQSQNLNGIGMEDGSLSDCDSLDENCGLDSTNKNRKKIGGIRALFAAHSPVFSTMLFGSMMESNPNNDVIINDISVENFLWLKKYIYNCNPILKATNVCDIIQIADKYSIDVLKHICIQFIVGEVFDDNFNAFLHIMTQLYISHMSHIVNEILNDTKIKLRKNDDTWSVDAIVNTSNVSKVIQMGMEYSIDRLVGSSIDFIVTTLNDNKNSKNDKNSENNNNNNSNNNNIDNDNKKKENTNDNNNNNDSKININEDDKVDFSGMFGLEGWCKDNGNESKKTEKENENKNENEEKTGKENVSDDKNNDESNKDGKKLEQEEKKQDLLKENDKDKEKEKEKEINKEKAKHELVEHLDSCGVLRELEQFLINKNKVKLEASVIECKIVLLFAMIYNGNYISLDKCKLDFVITMIEKYCNDGLMSGVVLNAQSQVSRLIESLCCLIKTFSVESNCNYPQKMEILVSSSILSLLLTFLNKHWFDWLTNSLMIESTTMDQGKLNLVYLVSIVFSIFFHL